MKNSPQSVLVSVVIPAKDEVKAIGDLISKIKETLAGYSHEIIVVDDGSEDETIKVAQGNGAVVIPHNRNLGKGAAMSTGVQNSSGEIIVFLDGDGAHYPQDIPALIKPILEKRADLVIGSRALPGASVTVSPLTRKLSNNLASVVISFIVSVLIPVVTLFRSPLKYIRITDCTSGFRAITRTGWQRLALTSQRFEIETEMIYEAARKRLTITEVPIRCNWNHRFSRLSIISDGWITLKLLLSRLLGDIGKR